jgi:hypothetical protein
LLKLHYTSVWGHSILLRLKTCQAQNGLWLKNYSSSLWYCKWQSTRNVFVRTTSMRAVESSVSSHERFLMVGQINSFSSSWIYDSYLHDKLSHAKIYFINDGICILWTWLNEKSLWRSNKEYKFYYGDAMLII